MVMDDAPALRKATQDQSEEASGTVLAADELPAPADERAVGPKDFNCDVGERELPHLAALALVALAVAIEGRLPALRLVAARGEGQLGRFPVSLHETLQIAAVPRSNL